MTLRPNASEQANHPMRQFFANRFSLNWEHILLIVIFVLAVFTRFYVLGERAMSHDESLHTRFSYNLYADGDFKHTPLMHGPILFHMTALSYSLFGDNDFTSRIYTSVLGVLMVMSPLLFRRWLGRWGTILACILLLISPMVMYYNRYIRHDTPSLLYALIMMWAILMYLSGPENQRRRAHWLYVIAAAMVLNLGSKETAFIYIAIFGVFLFLYWVVRLIQYFWNLPGRTIFNFAMIGTLLGAVLSLAMYNILDIIKFDLFANQDGLFFSQLSSYDQQVFFVWTGLAILTMLLVVLGSLSWVYRDKLSAVRWREVAIMVATMLIVCFLFVVIEEQSYTTPSGTDQPVAPVVPGEEGAGQGEFVSSISWAPMILVWAVALAGFVFLFLVRRRPSDGDEKDKAGRGFWGTMDLFPEFDLIVVIGTLILPWATALIPYIMKGTSADYINLANQLPQFVSAAVMNIPQVGGMEQVGQFMLHFLAWLPLMAVAIALGLAWNWRRWLIASAIFHVIFAFFFTTVFTNIAGLATGMIYSLGYWLEQQGVRRGSQPQYYYLLIIMPFYEFLPVIGSSLAMIAGMTGFWRWRRREHEQRAELEAVLQEEAVRMNEIEAGPDGELTRAEPVMDSRVSEMLYQQESRGKLTEVSFLLFFSWLGLLNLIGYSLAGEKMPWLATHLTTPLIFLTAWYFGRIFDRIAWRLLVQRGWPLLLLLPALFVTVLQVVGPVFIGSGPFGGLQTQQLQETYAWFASAAMAGGLAYGVWRVSRMLDWVFVRQMVAVVSLVLLSAMTFRSAWMASFINYDYANEFIVYAHAAPSIKRVLNDIEEISLRTTDGYDLRFAYDNSVSWPYSWYFRNYPNATFIGENPTVQNLDNAIVVVVGDDKRSRVDPILEDRYQRFEYIRLWWPMQDYFYLTPARVLNAFDFSPENQQANNIRQGLFDMWWSRDYTTYGLAVEKNFDLTRWPVSDRMSVYIRKDYAAQIWEYGVGDGEVLNPLDNIVVNQCNANWVDLAPNAIYQNSATPMNRPLGMALDADGNLYVAEEYGYRITRFDQAGAVNLQIGTQGLGDSLEAPSFNRPNSVAVGPDGLLYVVDTWNYQIQVIDPQTGETQVRWGRAGEYGFDAPALPTDAFWGPRDVKVDDQGRIYVTDTGNKRVRVYRIEGGEAVYLYDIGSGGSGPGQLDEPSSIALHPDGRVFVGDTWNRRVSVFTQEGAYLDSFPVRGWYDERGNRPYLAIDAEREILYVGDHDAGRVLVYSTGGECLGSFGQSAGQAQVPGRFGVVGGIVVAPDGSVWVSDAGQGLIYQFPAFDYVPATDAGEAAADENAFELEILPEQTEESGMEEAELAQPEDTENAE